MSAGAGLRSDVEMAEPEAAAEVAASAPPAQPEDKTPSPVSSRLERAGALYDERRLPEAELELQEALRLAPDDLRAWRLLARVRLRLGRAEDARAAFAAIAERAPDDGEARLQLGLAALKVGDVAAAAPELEAAVRLRPDDARAQQYLAYAWARLGRVGDAVDTFDRAGAPELAAAARALGAGAPVLDEIAVASLAAEHILPRESGAPAGSRLDRGVHRLPVEEGAEAHVAASALLSVLGDVTVEPAIRRRPGRLAEPASGGAGPAFLRCQGQGEVWVGAARAGQPLLSLRLEEDALYLREARVLGFSGALAFESGAIPGGGARLLHLRGRGRVVVDFAADDVVAIRISVAHRPKVPEARILGWLGAIVLQPDGGNASGGLPGARLCGLEGEGVLLIARHGQAEQPVHERAEPGDDGPGRADPRDSGLHR